MLRAVLLASSALAIADECSQYTNCRSCLNVTAPTGIGGRQNCGWCHFPIQYQEGGEGPRCADIRDHPWKCTDLYDTYKCSAGYKCNYDNGQCELSTDGEGYSKETCALFCKAHEEQYKCDMSTYQCVACKAGDINCFPKKLACSNCVAPAQKKYKCDRTNAQSPTCQACKNETEAGCSNHVDACLNCNAPQKQFTCDEKSLTCVEAKFGSIGGACNATCGKQVPPELQDRIFRGVEAHKGFGQGEWDFAFHKDSVTIRDPSNKATEAQVEMHGPGKMVIKSGSTELTFSVQNSNQGDETNTLLLATAGNGKDLVDAKTALNLDDGRVYVLSACNTWAKSCDFSSVKAVTSSLLELFSLAAPEVSDACNAYPDCHSCITASEQGVKCGWCMGGKLDYFGVGPTEFQCGGYKEGTPSKFTCEPLFQTVDCTGFACNWTTPSGPQCYKKDPAEFATAEACGKTCHAETMMKCNLVSKQCEPCKEGDAGCNTQAHCEASCNIPHAKCNTTTKQCETCDPVKDKNCTQSQGECGGACANSPDFMMCDVEKGECVPCQQGTRGCTPFAAHGSKDQCSKDCKKQPADEFVKCNWNTHTCEKTNETDPARTSKKFCESQCKAPVYAKCDVKNNVCQPCDPVKDPDCMQTKEWCDAAQKAGKCKAPAPTTLAGVWRGNEISKSYTRGEFDIAFNDDASQVTIGFFDTKQEKKWHASVAVSDKVTGVESGVTALDFTFDTVPTGDMLGVTSGKKVTGLFQVKDDWTGLFRVLYLAIPTANGQLLTFDTGMTEGSEFVLVGCKQAANQEAGCDFSKASPASTLLSMFI
jgi:hypothetical protein